MQTVRILPSANSISLNYIKNIFKNIQVFTNVNNNKYPFYVRTTLHQKPSILKKLTWDKDMSVIFKGLSGTEILCAASYTCRLQEMGPQVNH